MPHHQIVLMSYPWHSLRVFYPFAEMQSVYSAYTADKATEINDVTKNLELEGKFQVIIILNFRF